MYKPLKDEPNKSQDFKKDQEYATSNLKRETFVDNLLTEFVGDEKIKEKDRLCNQLKYKTHQLDVAIKQLKSDKKKAARNIKAINKDKIKCKIRKKYKINKIDTKEKKEFKNFIQMNELWNGYVTKVLGVDKPEYLSAESVLERLSKMDYHGALIEVTRSKTKGIIGLRGIVIQDTKNMFVLVTENDTVKMIPKYDNLFQIEVLGVKFTIVGTNICMKPELRSTKPSKPKTLTDIF